MFRGGFEHQVDQKGRLIVPARFRELLKPACFITKGFHRCLFIFPWEKWLEIEAKLKAASITDLNALALQRFFAAGVEGTPDSQGRLMIPPSLREYAGLEKDIFTLGANNRVEVWSKARWSEYEDQELSLEGILEKVAALGLEI
jgi:MraZ protein